MRQETPGRELNSSRRLQTPFGPWKKWNTSSGNVQVDDFVMVAEPNTVKGKWIIRREVEVYPGQDGRVRNGKVKTPTGEYSRLIIKIAVIQPAEGFDQ